MITVSYRAGDALLRTVENVLAQSFASLELIVKDGGSDDGSIEALCGIDDRRLRVVVEKDAGIYDAMNVAIALASGRYICFMNCGDTFADANVLEDVHTFAESLLDGAVSAPDAVIYGDIKVDGVFYRQPERITDFYLYRRPINHQSMFFGRGVFDTHGVYGLAYATRADHELTLRAWRGGTELVHIKRLVCEYEGGGFSELPEKRAERRAELESIRKKYFTASQRRRYDALLFFSMRRLRSRIAGGGSPRWLRRIYNALVGRFNG